MSDRSSLISHFAAPVLVSDENLGAELAVVVDQAARYARASRARATSRAYRTDWAHFESWCRGQGLDPIPAAPEVVGLYLAGHGEILAVATLTRRLSAIATAHRVAGHGFDTKSAAIADVLAGIKRTRGTAQRQADALTPAMLRAMVQTCGTQRLIDVRDRGLLLVGFSGAFRRSELVALNVDDILVSDQGLKITIRHSKSDQEGAGQVLGIGRTGRSTCPVAAYEGWLQAAGHTSGRAFRSVNRHGHPGEGLTPLGLAKMIKARARLAGLDASGISGHSLRAGFATSAAAAGIDERAIMLVTRHTGVGMVRRYIRDGEVFRRNLADEIGL